MPIKIYSVGLKLGSAKNGWTNYLLTLLFWIMSSPLYSNFEKNNPTYTHLFECIFSCTVGPQTERFLGPGKPRSAQKIVQLFI